MPSWDHARIKRWKNACKHDLAGDDLQAQIEAMTGRPGISKAEFQRWLEARYPVRDFYMDSQDWPSGWKVSLNGMTLQSRTPLRTTGIYQALSMPLQGRMVVKSYSAEAAKALFDEMARGIKIEMVHRDEVKHVDRSVFDRAVESMDVKILKNIGATQEQAIRTYLQWRSYVTSKVRMGHLDEVSYEEMMGREIADALRKGGDGTSTSLEISVGQDIVKSFSSWVIEKSREVFGEHAVEGEPFRLHDRQVTAVPLAGPMKMKELKNIVPDLVVNSPESRTPEDHHEVKVLMLLGDDGRRQLVQACAARGCWQPAVGWVFEGASVQVCSGHLPGGGLP